MEISIPNEYGVLEASCREIVALHGRSHADVEFALCQDRRYRFSVGVSYSYGGFCGPIYLDAEDYPTLPAARTAALEKLLRRWPRPFHSEPTSVHEELRIMREQIEGQLRQPSLF
jgi:hypothetical protein